MTQGSLFDPIGCLMDLYTERSNTYLTITTDCTLSFSTRSNCKEADLQT